MTKIINPLYRQSSDRLLCRSRGRGAAFTLIELIVALGIVVVLTSLLFAGMRGARETVNNTKCASNLRQSGVALLQFAADSNNRIETHSGGNAVSNHLWAGKLTQGDYLRDKQVTRCPIGDVRFKFDVGTWTWSTYALNMYQNGAQYRDLETGVFSWILKMGDIPNRSEFWLLADSCELNAAQGKFFQTFRVIADSSVQGGVALYHRGRANVFFADGHVQSMSRDDLLQIGCKKVYDAPLR